MRKALVLSAKAVALSACLATTIGVASASAAPATGQYAAYFFGSGSSVQEAAGQAESTAAKDGYWNCTIVDTTVFPGLWGPSYGVEVGCNQF